MKNVIKLLLCCTVLLGYSSCKKSDSSSTSTNPTPSSGFTFKVGGNLITADSSNAVLYNVNGVRTLDIYVFKGAMNGYANTILEMHVKPKTGSQTVAANSNNAWLTYFEDTTFFDCTSGHFNLTLCDTINNKLEGNFDFDGKSASNTTRSITEGNLKVSTLSRQ